MKRITVASILTGLLLIALTTGNAVAQQRDEHSIEGTLGLLGDKLEQYGIVRISYGPAFPGRQTLQRFEYMGSEGCVFRYRLRHQENSDSHNFEQAPAKQNPSKGYPSGPAEWSVNLAKIDPARIEIVTQKDWTGGFVNFYIADGTLAVKCHNCSGPNPNVYSTGGFAIGNKRALDAIASDVRQAVGVCRK